GLAIVTTHSVHHHINRITNANRVDNGCDRAQYTAPSEERLAKFFAIRNGEQLADVRARLARPIDPERYAADAELGVHRQVGHVRQAFDRDLLAKIAGPEAERIERGAVDDEHGAW